MVKKSESSLRLRKCSRDKFVESIGTNPLDKFAKTFKAKADAYNLWENLTGCWIGSRLAGAITWTITVRQPPIANLQLLHTFSWARRKGVATKLCEWFLESVLSKGAQYFRVAAEAEAIAFYHSLGIRFLGKQKSGLTLAIGKLGATFETCKYDLKDPIVKKAVYKKGKGGCVEVFQKINPGQLKTGVHQNLQ